MYYIYILYSPSAEKYYIGHTDNPEKRLHVHNHSDRLTYTSKHRPWTLAVLFQCSENRGDAIRIEKLIKKQKSRTFIEKLVQDEVKLYGELAQLVRVPHVRD